MTFFHFARSMIHSITTWNGFPRGGSSLHVSDVHFPEQTNLSPTIWHELGTYSPQLRHRHPFSNHSYSCSSLTMFIPPQIVAYSPISGSTTTIFLPNPVNSTAFRFLRTSGISPCDVLVKTVLNFRSKSLMPVPRHGH